MTADPIHYAELVKHLSAYGGVQHFNAWEVGFLDGMEDRTEFNQSQKSKILGIWYRVDPWEMFNHSKKCLL